MIKRIGLLCMSLLLSIALIACGTDNSTIITNYTEASQTSTNNTTETTESTSHPLSTGEVFTLLSQSTVEINCSYVFNSESAVTISCTGVFIDTDGTIITNYSTLSNCDFDDWTTVTAITYDGTEYAVNSVIGYNKELDIVILATSATNTAPIQIRTTSAQTGEKVYLLSVVDSKQGLTITEGIVSYGAKTIEDVSYIQHTATTTYYSAGGPLVDEYGNVIGVAALKENLTGASHLAIPISAINTIERNLNLTIAEFIKLTQG